MKTKVESQADNITALMKSAPVSKKIVELNLLDIPVLKELASRNKIQWSTKSSVVRELSECL